MAPVTPAAAAPPDTSITSGPSGLIASRSATFRFAANVRRASFECKLDGKAWRACESPKKYSRLKQGPHTFRVRARKKGTVDPTPAVRSFTVDTVRPDTAIRSGPITEDHIPIFIFSSTEPGSFECELETTSFEPCSNPFVPASPLPDGSYTLAVRARDEAGNVDKTPASQGFIVETPITNDLATAQAAAALYFPDALDMDAPASCGTDPAIDCPDGNPLPPADQVRIESIRSVVEVPGQNRYDVSATLDVTTLQAIKVSAFGLDCDLTMNSANGADPDWDARVSLNFYVEPSSGDYYIYLGNMLINGVEVADYAFSGDFGCTLVDWGSAYAQDSIVNTLEDQFGSGSSLCAAPGPAYLGPCPEQ